MMSLRALGNLSASGTSAKAAAHYYNEAASDYYAKDESEKQGGQWIGSGAERQRLHGTVNQEQLQLVLAGHSCGQAVQNAGKANRQMGWDLTFSAPKSVSLAWAFANPEQRTKIEQAHQKALEAAYQYLESKTTTRRGSMGKIKEPAFTLAVSYTHHTSRANDPQLHSHVVVSNYCVRKDGTVGTIESKSFYDYKMAAGGLYQTELAYNMRKLGYEIENDKKGTFRLKEVDKNLEKIFSKREAQISKLSKERDIQTYAGTRQVVLATRPDKTPTNLAEREQFWRSEAQSAGLSTDITRAQKSLEPEKIDTKTLTNTLKEKIVRGNSVFKEKDAIRNIATANLGQINAEQAKEIFYEAQREGQMIAIGTDKSGNTVYSTHEMIGLEKQMLRHVENMADKNHYRADVNQAINKREYLSQEQKDSIEAACGKNGIAVIQGRAGTGKTTMLSAVKEAYEQDGWKIQGICFTGQAAQCLAIGKDTEPNSLVTSCNDDVYWNSLFLHHI